MKTKIVVDSSSSLYALPGVDFACVPLKIVTDEQEYLDDGTLDAVGMARSLRTYKGKTSTSCPNVADWLAAYEGAEQIFVATITGTLSGSYNAALLAAEEYKETHPEARVFVLDSLSAGPELRLLAERLRDLVRIGMEFDEICEAILAYHKHTHLLFSLESLANLARNGRVKPAVAAVARMLGIRVIGQASESGELEVLCKTRGEHGALERIVLELKDKMGVLDLGSSREVQAAAAANTAGSVAAEAVEALVALGYGQSDAAVAVGQMEPGLSVDEMIRRGLRQLSANL